MFGMRRREFIALLGAAAWPLVARAAGRSRATHRRAGGYAEGGPKMKARLTSFHQALEALGWSGGRNLRFDSRFAP